LGILEEADSLSPEFREDQDVLEIMEAMQAAREAADNPEALDERYEEFSRKLEEQKNTEEFESIEEDI